MVRPGWTSARRWCGICNAPCPGLDLDPHAYMNHNGVAWRICNGCRTALRDAAATRPTIDAFFRVHVQLSTGGPREGILTCCEHQVDVRDAHAIVVSLLTRSDLSELSLQHCTISRPALRILAGATLLLAADSFARIVVAPAELPIGLVTAAIGSPFFLWLLMNRKRSL